MTGSGTPHIMAACEACGTVYAAMRASTGRVLPIGSRGGCSSCGGTEFEPLSITGDDLESTDDAN